MKFQTIFKLRQPLSHIGESESATVFLNTIKVVNDGKAVDVFAYNGNAFRGALRDCAARHMLKLLGVKVKKQTFNILFSGGNISGNLSNDVEKAREWRRLVPMVSLFGAGVGDQILAGKLTQTFALPVCEETKDIIPAADGIDTSLFGASWRKMTGTISFNRTDDLKNINLNGFAVTDGEKEKDPQQMRYEVEYFAPGTQLYHEMDIADASDMEIGVLAAALREFAEEPALGGMAGKGFGRVDLCMTSGGERAARIGYGGIELSGEMLDALNAYERHIRENREEITAFLGGVPVEE